MANETVKLEKKKLVRLLLIAACIGMIGFGLFFTIFCKATGRTLISSSQYNRLKKIAARYEKLDALREKMNTEGYFKVGREKQMNAIYKGLVKSLKDPYSEYLSKADLADFSEDMEGEYVGVGMSISKKKGEALEVVSPFIGSPAEKVGIKIKDRIIKVDGKDILPLTANETVKLLKGKEGTKVDVEVVREGKKEPMKFTLTRAKIKLEMVESKMLENNIGYVSLLRFGNHVGAEVEKAIKDLQAKGMKGLILDLRSNPGGSLQEAQDISSLFVKEDLIVYLKYKNGQQRNYNRTSKNLGNFPLIVLTNKASASASEIVTGAIKDYKRGTIIGEKTFGKGIVQQVIPLRTEDAIKLTIAQYFTPKGNYIHEKGIEPDIEVKMEELLALKGYANDSEQARKNREKEIETLQQFVNQWNEIGNSNYSKKSIDLKFHKIIDALYKKLNFDKQEIEIIKYNNKLERLINDDNENSLNNEVIFVRRRIDELKSEILQLENNLAFFGNIDEKNPLVRDVIKNINNQKEALKTWENKLRELKHLQKTQLAETAEENTEEKE